MRFDACKNRSYHKFRSDSLYSITRVRMCKSSAKRSNTFDLRRQYALKVQTSKTVVAHLQFDISAENRRHI